MRARIFLVRHGATVLTAEDRFAGATNVQLSDEGREQVHRLAARLRATVLHLSRGVRKLPAFLMETGDHKPFMIRSYRASDREAVQRLCCETGFLGEPIDPVYEDRRLFADFPTTYYTDHEPESSFVLEMDGEIRGDLLGSRRLLQNQLYALYQNVWLFFRALARYFPYNKRSRRFIRWTIVHGWREVPAALRRVPHFHINLLPDGRISLRRQCP
jgi:Histidine phosphatase superfamily (branch 1)